jgi:hypothetical protein
MSTDDPGAITASGNGDTAGTGEEWKHHPMYISLSSRLSATESAISSLSSQVSSLHDIVSRALPKTLVAPPAAAGEKADTIAALTQQISALSTSVAQLQRLQSVSLTNLSRQTSRAGQERNNDGSGPPSLGLGNLSLHSNANQNQNVFNTGPLTAPHPAGPGAGPFGPSKHLPRDFHNQRPQSSRAVSSNILPPAAMGLDGDKTWGPPTRNGGNPISPGGGWPTMGNVPTTPGGQGQQGGVQGGGMMTPSIVGPSQNGNGNGNGNGGPGVPGAGIVVTKWDHLNLKPELVRSVQKYG